MASSSQERRVTPRAAMTLPVALERAHGRPLNARTRDLGPAGMSLQCDRPLAIDELLRFVLVLDGQGVEISGQGRVCREQLPGVYAIRFERLAPGAAVALQRLI